MTAVATNKTGPRVEALLALMRRLGSMHDELHASLTRKLALLREARTEEVQACLGAEHSLWARITEQEGLRKQLAEQVARSLGVAPDASKRVRASMLASRLDEPHRSRLADVAGNLKDSVERVRRVNGLIGRVSADVTRHLGEVFASIRVTGETAPGYSKKGTTVAAKPRELFVAIG